MNESNQAADDPELTGKSAHLTTQRLEKLPPEIGILMLGFGVAGLIFPGPFGTPLIVAGGLSLWPKGFRRVDGWVARKLPKSHESGHRWLERFMDDLEQRYPETA